MSNKTKDVWYPNDGKYGNDENITSLGRNGYIKTKGVNVRHGHYCRNGHNGENCIRLTPINSRNRESRGFVEFPSDYATAKAICDAIMAHAQPKPLAPPLPPSTGLRAYYACVVCQAAPVDAENGFDTCPGCLAKQ